MAVRRLPPHALKRLETGGAAFVVMASKTPHHRHSTIVSGIDVQVLNLFDAVALRCEAECRRDVLIPGTALTMRSQVLRDAFKAKGIEALAPKRHASRGGADADLRATAR